MALGPESGRDLLRHVQVEVIRRAALEPPIVEEIIGGCVTQGRGAEPELLHECLDETARLGAGVIGEDTLARLLPASVAVAVSDAPGADPPLEPIESAGLVGAVGRRRREFAIGRYCARRALGRLGEPVHAIPVGDHRQPLWPPGIIGSITHCQGFCAAAVARTTLLRGLGIDAEPVAILDDEVSSLIATPLEQVRALAEPPAVGMTLLFSAKESVFKCMFPLTGVFLEFLDVTISLQADGTFVAGSRLLDLTPLVGRYAVVAGHVLTTAVIPG
ncbi:MAG: 4'-phosphopantetheinyl transferase superfamily protein [Gaiellales bacterium]